VVVIVRVQTRPCLSEFITELLVVFLKALMTYRNKIVNGIVIGFDRDSCEPKLTTWIARSPADLTYVIVSLEGRGTSRFV
jgi:hypothetical protein